MYKFYRRIISAVLLIATMLSIISVGAVSASAVSATVITTDAVRLRSSAEITSDNILATLDTQEELTVLKDSTNGWAYVSRSNGTKGYCSINYLAVPSGSGVVINGVTTEEVNFRKGPSTDYASIKLLSANTAFTVVDNTEELWVKVSIDGTTGYVYRTYTKLGIKLPTDDDFMPADDPDTPNWFESSALDDLLGDADSDNPAPLTADIDLSDSTISLEEGSTYTLSAYITGGSSLQSAVSFISSDTSVATVSKNGTVKGVSTGTAVITAIVADSGKSAICKVTVTESTTEPAEEPINLSQTSVSVLKGNHYQLTADIPVNWKSSDTSVVTVSDGIITAKNTGTATVTAYTATQTATCTVTVKSASSSISIYNSAATVTVGKTYYNGATSSSTVTWTSSDTSVATVTNGFITAVSSGKAVITAKNSGGTKTCLVTVKDAEPIRFAYSQPNTAAKNETITLFAVTDKNRTAVKFDITVGGKIKTVNATDKITDGNTFVWSGTTTISSSGTYDVVAYSKQGGDWQTCLDSVDDAKTTVFIRETADKDTESQEKRRASDELVKLLSEFEGYSPSVYFDTIANNIPTLGYGKVIYIGDSFYNDMTKREAYAYLVQTVNNDGYTSAVNNYLDKYNINRNQRQFDSLVSFVYNLGANILSGDSEFKNIFLATGETHEDPVSDTEAYINATDVNLRSGASTSDKILATLDYGTTLTLLDTAAVNGWYHVRTESGTEGYVYASYVSKGRLSSTAEYSLGRVDKQRFNKLMLQYHHAGVTCVLGLLNRRVDELDVFYYGDYVRNGSKNAYNYSFTCSVNSSTTL